jgi:hypothetical protein
MILMSALATDVPRLRDTHVTSEFMRVNVSRVADAPPR